MALQPSQVSAGSYSVASLGHRAHGVEQQYWVVRRNGSLMRPVAEGETYALLESTHKRQWDRLESDARHERTVPRTQEDRHWWHRVRGRTGGTYCSILYAGTTDHTLGNPPVLPHINTVVTCFKGAPFIHDINAATSLSDGHSFPLFKNSSPTVWQAVR
ncbi:hypothetical protein VE03_10222 [Pseudogymnoascus sp. 23342-1-I1]|nr:hypothetical protein VE03_10222 [Pseudogymnoascus sp. 23342-1-I1]